MLQIYNSLTKKKEPFIPLQPNHVGIYVCGITVYDYCHLGHARSLVCFDIVVRYLRARGYEVNYVRNITDIDDKIIKRANETAKPWQDLTAYFIAAMHEDERALNILPPNEEPKATEHMADIIALIQQLLDKGFAYVADNGDIYYDVASFKHYGRLSNKDLEGQAAGARVEIVTVKRNPLDFVLWKQAKPNEPFWHSPWGNGRPGWHIECSAMSMCCLGSTFDIHGGGFDLQFPHHENEIAQSEAATGKLFASTWMHVGFLQINYEKMSKSLGNFFTIRDILKDHSAEAVRYFLLMSHYRSQLNYSTENLNHASQALERLYLALRNLPIKANQQKDYCHDKADTYCNQYDRKFYEAMDDDFNTPEALAVLFEISHEINRLRTTDIEQATRLAETLLKLGDSLGILQQEPEAFFKVNKSEQDVALIEQLIAARQKARDKKDWASADKIRKQLTDLGVDLEDTAQGTQWRSS